jgi:TPR repeat protein
MQSTRTLAPVAAALLLALSGCSQNEDAARANAAAAAQVAPASGTEAMRKLRPLTDIEKAKDAYSKYDFSTALHHFRAAATAGDPDAQYYTGLMYAQGEGVAKKDLAEAVRWYEKAAARDQPDALYALARLYVVGYGVERDSQKAVQLLDRAIQYYPPGESKDRATEQRLALVTVLDEQRKAAETEQQK